jgi:hypothetical protein
MERPYLNHEVRRSVAKRADYLCEYCLISEYDTILGCAIDHILIDKKKYPSSVAMRRMKD